MLPFLKVDHAATTSLSEDARAPERPPAPFYTPEGRKGEAVGESNDLRRILALERRVRPTDGELRLVAEDLKVRFGKPNPKCQCHKLKPYAKNPCADNLKPVQAWALMEGLVVGGILGPIGVGHGKTLLDLLMPMVVGGKTWVLLLPPALKMQLLESDWNYYGQHWHLPNLATGKGVLGWYKPGAPFLHVIAFSELSGAKSSTLLDDLDPDGIVVDEAHSVRNHTAARTKRFLRFLEGQNKPTSKRFSNKTKLFCWSGTLVSRSLRDYAHLAEHSLRDGSPVPLHWPTVEEWAAHLDPSDLRAPSGQLWKLSGEKRPPLFDGADWDARPAFRERLVSTPGVISSGDTASCQASLIISERPLVVPAKVEEALRKFNEDARKEAWKRPDGEELVDALSAARCARELSCGFYYRWRWPKRKGEPQKVEVIKQWLEARKEWHKELRERLKRGGKHMDSPLLCTRAAIRWYEGYTYVEKGSTKNPNFDPRIPEDSHDYEPEFIDVEVGRKRFPPFTKNGPYPTWEALSWPRWRELHDTAEPETEAVWIDDFLVEDCLKWLDEGPGLLWYEHAAFATRLFDLADQRGSRGRLAFAGPGEDGNRALLTLTGKESVVASIRAHGTGKNLQQFARNCVPNPPSDGGTWEQLLGRTHRTGQEADEVTFEVYRHTEAFINAVERARDLSEFIQDTFGATQRLASVATWRF